MALYAFAVVAVSDVLPTEFWRTLRNLWPLGFVAIGLFVLLRDRSALVRSGFPMLVLVGAVAGSWLYSGLAFPRFTTEFLAYNFALGETKTAKLELDLGIDEVATGMARDSGQLLVAQVDRDTADNWKGTLRYEPTVEFDGDSVFVRLRHSSDPRLATSLFGTNKRRWQIGLNPAVPFHIVVNGGVGRSNLNLTGLAVRRLNVNGGVGRTDIVFPSLTGLMEAAVVGGVGEIGLRVPEDVGVTILVNRGIGEITLGDRFGRTGEGSFESQGSRLASGHLQLMVDVGVGNITIE